MSLSLGSRTIQLVKRRVAHEEYIPTRTGFITNDGPEIGTIWLMADHPQSKPVEVADVGKYITWDPNPDKLTRTLTKAFIEQVRRGEWILIGVRPPSLSATAY